MEHTGLVRLSERHAVQRQWRWRNFSIEELSCRCRHRFCTGDYWHDPAFLDALQALRDDVGVPLIVNSGHRCAQWNARVGGAPASMHLKLAVDLSLTGHDRQLLLARAQRRGFTGIGLAKSFIHLDRRTRPAQWFYPGSEALWQT